MTADRDALAGILYSTLAVDPDDSTLVVGYDRTTTCYTWGDARTECNRVADAIIAAGYVKPERAELVGSWYRTLTPDGKVWCETSDPTDSYLLHDTETVTFQRSDTYRYHTGWQPWTPTEHIEPLDRD